MAATNNKPASPLTEDFCLAPLPPTQRGYNLHIDAHEKKQIFAYTSGLFVYVRSLENFSQCSVYSGHTARVNVARISPNGEWIASGDDHGKVMVWSIKSHILKNEVQVNRRVLDIAWSKDGKRLVACGEGSDTKAKAFPWDSGNKLGTVGKMHEKNVLSCDFKPTRPFRVATCGEDFRTCHHEGPPFKLLSHGKAHSNFANCVRYSPDGNWAATAGSDRKIVLYDAKTGEVVREIEGHEGSVFSLAWSPDSTRILSASGDKTARVWNAEDGALVATFVMGSDVGDQQVSAAWAGEHLMTAGVSGAITFHDLDNPEQPRFVLQGHKSVTACAATADAVFSVGANGKITAYDRATGIGRWFEGGHGKKATHIAISADGESLVTAGLDDAIHISSIAEAAVGPPIGTTGRPLGMAVSRATPGLVVAVTVKRVIHLVRDGAMASTISVSYDPTCAAISPDDTECVVGGQDGKVRVYSLDGELTETTEFAASSKKVVAVCYNTSGDIVTYTDSSNNIYSMRRSENYKRAERTGWTYHTAPVIATAWSSDDSKMVSASSDQSIFVWPEAGTFGNKRIQQLQAHHLGVTSLVLVDDGHIVTSGKDDTIRGWTLPE